MATYQERNGRIRAIVRRKGLPPQSKSFDRKTDAVRWARKMESEIDEGDFQVPLKSTVRELLVRYRDEVSPTKPGAKWEITRLNLLMRDKFADEAISNCVDAICDWRERRIKEVSSASVNRELNVLSGVFTYAIKRWRVKLKSNPVQHVVRPAKAKPRSRRVQPNELAAIWRYFGLTPPKTTKAYVPWMFEFACETGLRMQELSRLRWQDVHFDEGTIYVAKSKNGDDRHALLTQRAEELLRGLPRLDDRVFPVNAGSIGVEFRDGCKALEIQDLHFHDSRHEATSQLAKKLLLQELAAVIGHRDYKSLQTYYNPTGAELAAKLRGTDRPTPARPTQPT
jgi:integrase